MKRRDFLAGTAGLTGLIVPVVGRAVTRPCPPGSLGISGGSSVTTSCSLADAEPDWLTRSTGPGVVFAHDFRAESEIESFVKIGTDSGQRDAARTQWESTGIPGTGGGTLVSRCFGTTLAQNVATSVDGAVEVWKVTDGSALPDPALGAYNLLLGQGSQNSPGEMVKVTAKSGNLITVTRGSVGNPQSYLAGEKIGTDPSDNWHRPLCAVSAPNNGKTVDDIGITQGHSVARPWVRTSTSHTRNAFGWWGKEKANWPRWTDSNNRTWTEPFEGTEFYLQFRVKWSAQRFADGETGKWFYLDANNSGMQQIFGNFTGAGTNVSVPVWRRSYGDSRAIAGNNFGGTGTVEAPNGDYSSCMVGDVRNPATCFNIMPDQWITFLFHLKPGFSNYRARVEAALVNPLPMVDKALLPEENIAFVDASTLPDPATWGTYPLELRVDSRTEILKVISKSGNTLHVMRNWWRDSGDAFTFPAGTAGTYGPTNRAPDSHEASWVQDAHLCPYYDSYFSVYAAYEGETTYRKVFESPALPFIYGAGDIGNYGNGVQQLPGYCFFKPESYMNAYLGSGSQGPPGAHTARYTQIILSRNFIPCPKA